MESNNSELKGVKIDKSIVGHFRYKKVEDKYLITNDFGYFEFLSVSEFKKYIQGELEKDSDLYLKLKKKGFLKIGKEEDLITRMAEKNRRLKAGPSLHIVVPTMRCNYNCIYCQASAEKMDSKNLDMDIVTARKVVDRIFQSKTGGMITIEFQGGEPMANWEVVEFITEYARGLEEEIRGNIELRFSLVTNLSLMTEERLNFLIDNGVRICTSLDGPKHLQNKNRPFSDGDSYEEITRWTEKNNEIDKKRDEPVPPINALLTISKFSLDKYKEIIDEYRKFDFPGIHLRPLSNLGKSGGEAKDKIGYSVNEFMEFWRNSMDYILKINKEGEFFSERGSTIKLTKILGDKDPGYTDLASPCGAVIGQVVYDHNGDIYTCDEGRMLDEDIFKLGNVDDMSYEEMINSDTCKAMIDASLLENQPCDLCVYKPYCGVCPVKNYGVEGNLFPQIRDTEWCKIRTAQFEYLFSKLKDKKNQSIFKEWVKKG